MSGTHGRFSMNRLGRGCRSGLVLGGLAALVLLAVVPAFGDTPETGADPSVTLTVTPSDGLSDGQTVVVTGTQFPPNSVGVIRECGGSAAVPECDLSVTVPFTTTATGDIPPTSVTVTRIIHTGTTTFNCGAQSCALVATAGGRTSQHHIRMASAGTSVPSSSVPPTLVPPTLVPPIAFPPGAGVPGPEFVCTLLRSLIQPFPFLQGLLTDVLALLSCPVTA
jgi:hypothetical protein